VVLVHLNQLSIEVEPFWFNIQMVCCVNLNLETDVIEMLKEGFDIYLPNGDGKPLGYRLVPQPVIVLELTDPRTKEIKVGDKLSFEWRDTSANTLTRCDATVINLRYIDPPYAPGIGISLEYDVNTWELSAIPSPADI
jgi:hypothetical protein